MIETFAVASVIVVLGCALQSAIGFGFGLFAIPMMILFGLAPYEAIVIVVLCSFAQTVIGAWQLRAYIDWALVVAMVLIAGATLPVGVWMLDRVTGLETGRVRQIFGAIVIFVLAVQWFARITPRDHLHWGWMVLAHGLAGFMGGFAGMGGPPVVVWIMAQKWSNRQSRGMLWALFAGLTPLQIVFLSRQFGDRVVAAAGLGAMLVPVAMIGILPGLWVGHRIPRDRLRRISLGLLFLLAVYMVVQPWARVLAQRVWVP